MSTLYQVIIRDVFANLPAAGVHGRIFISTDTSEIYYDTGSAWELVSTTTAGSSGWSSTAVSATGTASMTTQVTIEKITAAADLTRTLPQASTVDGKVYKGAKVDTGAGTATIQAYTGDTIGSAGDTAYELTNPDQYVELLADGANNKWIIVGGN